MLKIISPANRHLSNRPALADFTRYWTESHGPLFSNTKLLWGYVQHHTLPAAFDGLPKPTFDGASVFYYENLDALRNPLTTPEALALREEVGKDDRQLFDRSDTWPMHLKRASIVGTEKVILDGAPTPSMVKLVLLVSRLPGLTIEQFCEHWEQVHAPLAAALPGLRRYVQNHSVLEAYGVRGMSHDGWAELWFDDLSSLQAAYASPEWAEVRKDSAMLFAEPRGVVIARETVQKWDFKATTTFDVPTLSEDEIRQRLENQGYESLAADPSAPGRIKAASQAGLLAVWTPEHIVTIDASRIDAVRSTELLAHFRTLFEYNRWANQIILDAAAEVSDADYFADAPGLSFGNLHATLVHALVAEIVWLARWQGGLPPEALKDARIADRIAVTEIPTFAEVRQMFAEEAAKQERFFAALTKADIERPMSYKTQFGEPNTQPMSETMAHMFNHGTQFRAEAAVRLSQLGRSPGDVDLIIFLRQRR